MKYLPYPPLMQGLLTGALKRSGNWDNNDDRSNNPKLNGEAFLPYYNCVEELKALAQEVGVPLLHLAIHWLVAQQEVGPVIAGAHTIEQIKDNVSFSRLNTRGMGESSPIYDNSTEQGRRCHRRVEINIFPAQ
ncbi:aldo/keto reductase [Vibrio astriarenae]